MIVGMIGCRNGSSHELASPPRPGEPAVTDSNAVLAARGPLSVGARWAFDVAVTFPDARLGRVVMEAARAHGLVILRQRASSAPGLGPIVGLDAATGRARFSETGLIALVDAHQVWLIGVDPDQHNPEEINVRALDPLSGATIRTVALNPPLSAAASARFALVGDALVAATPSTLIAYDLVSGRQRWSRSATTSELSDLEALGEEAVLRTEGKGLETDAFVANSISDGAELWRKSRENFDAAVARGNTVYIRRVQESVDVVSIGGSTEHLAGARDANADWVLRRDDAGVSIIARPGGTTTAQRLARPETSPSGYILDDDWLIYGGKIPATLYAYEFATGRSATLCETSGGIDCDKIRVVQIAAPYVFLLDGDRLRAFKLKGLGK